MEKEFVPYEMALRMKALGFNEPCLMVYNYKKQVILNNKIPFEERTNQPNPYLCTAPLFSQAFRWFRDNYGLHHVIHQLNFKKGTDEEYLAEVDKKDGFSYFRTYEECEYYCLEQLIEIVEQKQKENGG